MNSGFHRRRGWPIRSLNNMRKILCTIFPVATLCLFGCDRQISSESYTETKVEWRGATAENIRDVVRSIAPGVQIAVIQDGGAILYHRGSVAETQKELDGSAGMRPVELTVSAPVAKEGKLPEAPNQEALVQINWDVDSGKAATLGIRMAEITSRLRELEQNEASAAEAIQVKTIKTQSGSEVPLNSLVEAKLTTVIRPIILNK